jgi:succinate dehydrogenase/fumarate reductase cytochrome b subunit
MLLLICCITAALVADAIASINVAVVASGGGLNAGSYNYFLWQSCAFEVVSFVPQFDVVVHVAVGLPKHRFLAN